MPNKAWDEWPHAVAPLGGCPELADGLLPPRQKWSGMTTTAITSVESPDATAGSGTSEIEPRAEVAIAELVAARCHGYCEFSLGGFQAKSRGGRGASALAHVHGLFDVSWETQKQTGELQGKRAKGELVARADRLGGGGGGVRPATLGLDECDGTEWIIREG